MYCACVCVLLCGHANISVKSLCVLMSECMCMCSQVCVLILNFSTMIQTLFYDDTTLLYMLSLYTVSINA